jgi:hypothetical protein
MASSAIMNKHLWASVVLGPCLVFSTFFLVLLFPNDCPVGGKAHPNAGPDPAPAPEAKSTLHTIRTAMALFKGQSGLVLILLGFVLRCLGDGVMALLIIYASQVFDWSFSQVSSLHAVWSRRCLCLGSLDISSLYRMQPTWRYCLFYPS